jgi:hypothetical protein
MRIVIPTITLLLLIWGMPAISSEESATIKPFKTDYCTFFPDGPPQDSDRWADCCLFHDMAYYVAGTKTAMNIADSKLRKCIASKGGWLLGELIYWSVRAGHLSPIKMDDHKWGWAYDERPPFRPLTIREEGTTITNLQKHPTHPNNN